MANLEKAYALDIKIRLEDEKLPPESVATAVKEFEQDRVTRIAVVDTGNTYGNQEL